MEAVHACALRVFEALGTGRRENVYQAALAVELGSVGQHLRAEVSHPITYRGHHVGVQRLDLEAEEYFIELKAVSRILPTHVAQTCAYVRDRRKPGILINFGACVEIQWFDYGVDTPTIRIHKIMTTTFPVTRNNLLDTDVQCKIVKSTIGGEVVYHPKLVVEAGDKQFPVFRTCPALATLYSTLGENGDMEKFNKSIKEARFNLTLYKNVPNRVSRVMPTLEEDQQKAFDRLKQDHEALVGAAFDSDDVKCSFKEKFKKQAKKKLGKAASPEDILALARELYIENSSNCGIKIREWKDPNGEEQEGEVLVVKRRVSGMRDGELTSLKPIFHKINHEGDYNEVSYEDYVPRDTLLKVRVRPQFFTAPLMYGTSCWFDKDIIVLWRPKRVQVKKEIAAVPVFEDGDDDEPSGKRAREDEDETTQKRARKE